MKEVLKKAVNLGKKFGRVIDANSSVLAGAKKLVNDEINLAVAAKKALNNKTAKNLTEKEINALRGAVGISENVQSGQSLYVTLRDNKAYKQRLKELSQSGDEAANKLKKISDLKDKNIFDKIDELEKMGYSKKDILKNAAKDYYSLNNGIKVAATRYGATAGAYMGANMLMRSATGGSLYRNNKGEADIAGIPFI